MKRLQINTKKNCHSLCSREIKVLPRSLNIILITITFFVIQPTNHAILASAVLRFILVPNFWRTEMK